MAISRDEPTTSEMRHDWLTDRWVIVAPQRTERPIDFVHLPVQVVSDQNCPFCIGHESQTPDSVACYYEQSARSHSGMWRVRVVPNKFPAVPKAPHDGSNSNAGDVSAGLQLEVQEATKAFWGASSELAVGGSSDSPTNGLFRRRDLSGGHEVIIEGPEHRQSLSQLDRLTTRLVFHAYRDRLHYWLVQREFSYAVVFKNVGHQAGASLVHSHSQLISTDILPTDVARVAGRMETYFEQKGQCLICSTVQEELEQAVRIVELTSDFVAYCPFASRLPSMVTIVPRHHQSQFELLDDSLLDQLSWLVHRLVRRLEHCYPEAAYNYIIYTAPQGHQNTAWFHWRIELFPRLSTLAGFEWGSECFINPQTPEAAARHLRMAGV